MTRKKAALTCTIILLAVVGYCLYCMRPFYLEPDIHFDEDVPDTVRRDIEEWYYGSDYSDPTPFSVFAAKHCLMHPFNHDDMPKVIVEAEHKGYSIALPWPEGNILYAGDKPTPSMYSATLPE